MMMGWNSNMDDVLFINLIMLIPNISLSIHACTVFHLVLITPYHQCSINTRVNNPLSQSLH